MSLALPMAVFLDLATLPCIYFDEGSSVPHLTSPALRHCPSVVAFAAQVDDVFMFDLTSDKFPV